MHLLPFDGEKCRLNKNKASGYKHLSFDGEKSSNTRKGLTCSEVLDYAAWPLQRAAGGIVFSLTAADWGELDPDLRVAPSSSSQASTEGEEVSEIQQIEGSICCILQFLGNGN